MNVFSFKSVKNLLSSKQDSHVLDPELAQSYRKLERLSGTVDVLQKNCARFMELGIQLTEAGLTLANEVGEFYSNSDLDSRQKSVRGFIDCQTANHNKSNEELRANLSGQGALAEFSTWSEELAIAKSKVDECQRVKAEVTIAERRLVSLRENLRKKRDKTGGLFAFGATNCEILDIEQKIPQLESQHRQLAQKASSLKIEVDQITSRIVANRFDTFDAIFTSLMETQMDFYSRCNTEAKKLERWTSNYRRQFPKRRLSNANPYVEISSKSWRPPATSPLENPATTPEPEIVAGPSGTASVELDTIVDMDVKEDVKEELPTERDLALTQRISNEHISAQQDLSLSNPVHETQNWADDSFPSTKDLLGLEQDNIHQTSFHSDEQVEENSSKRPRAVTDIGTMDFLSLNPESDISQNAEINRRSQSFDFLNSLVTKKDKEHHNPLNIISDQEINVSLLDDITHDDLSMFLESPVVPTIGRVKVQRSDSHGDEIMKGFGKKTGPKRLMLSEREQKEIAIKMEQSKRDYAKRLEAERNIQVAYEGELSKVEAKLNKWEYMGEEGKQRRNIRNLLSTLHNVLWPNSSWTPVAVSGLITKKKIKEAYWAAIHEVHPDKHTKDPLEVQAISSRTFEALNEAFNDFRQQNR